MMLFCQDNKPHLPIGWVWEGSSALRRYYAAGGILHEYVWSNEFGRIESNGRFEIPDAVARAVRIVAGATKYIEQETAAQAICRWLAPQWNWAEWLGLEREGSR